MQEAMDAMKLKALMIRYVRENKKVSSTKASAIINGVFSLIDKMTENPASFLAISNKLKVALKDNLFDTTGDDEVLDFP